MLGNVRPVSALEVLWEDDALVVRTPVRAFKRRGTIDTLLSPIVAGFLVPIVVNLTDPDDMLVWLLLGVLSMALLGSTLSGVYRLTFATRLSQRSTWTFRRVRSLDGDTQIALRGGPHDLNLTLGPGSRAVALSAWFPAARRLVVQDSSGRVSCVLSPRVPEYYLEELSRALAEINRLLAGGTLPSSSSEPILVGREARASDAPSVAPQTTPGERSLAMLCYLPVQGVFLLASIGCLVASRSEYVRRAAKQSLLHFGFSLLMLGLILLFFGLPTALVGQAEPRAVLAGSLAVALVCFAVWNLGAHVYACIRFYQGRPWVMPWLRPVARRWFE